MTSLSKVNVREYLSNAFGGLYILAVAALVLGWLAALMWLINSEPLERTTSPLIVFWLAVACAIVHVFFQKDGPAGQLTRRCFRNKVLGNVAYFYIDDSRELKYVINTLPKEKVYLVWKLPLGGWFKGKSRLLELVGYRSWKEFGWKLVLFSHWTNLPFGDCGRIAVYAEDTNGNRLTTTLFDALKILGDGNEYHGGLVDCFKGYPEAKSRVAEQDCLISKLVELSESTISRIDGFKRFGMSERGKKLKRNIDSELSILFPNRERRFKDEPEPISK